MGAGEESDWEFFSHALDGMLPQQGGGGYFSPVKATLAVWVRRHEGRPGLPMCPFDHFWPIENNTTVKNALTTAAQ